MTSRAIHLLDRSSTRIAALDVMLIGDLYQGTICLDSTPPQLKRLFEEFEECVEGQVFSLADEIEEKIEALSLRVLFSDGVEVHVEDLQVYPSTKRVSFKAQPYHLPVLHSFDCEPVDLPPGTPAVPRPPGQEREVHR